jgi:hypothetical protein
VIVALLALVVRLLPRRDWRRAMLAEVMALDDPRARRRFALGCIGTVLTQRESWWRIGALAVVGAVPVLLLSGPGGGHDVVGQAIAGVAVALCLVAATRIEDLPGVAPLAGTGGFLWWGGVLASETVRAHPQWALAVILACAVAAGRRGGAVAALGTAFAACLTVFVLAVGTYAALPRLAPPVAPANATNPRLENQIESADPYVAELLLAALCGLGLVGVMRIRPMVGPVSS